MSDTGGLIRAGVSGFGTAKPLVDEAIITTLRLPRGFDAAYCAALPDAAGLHPGVVTEAFTLLDFPPNNHSGGDTAVVYAEGLTSELYLDKPREMRRYGEAQAVILPARGTRPRPRTCCRQPAKGLGR